MNQLAVPPGIYDLVAVTGWSPRDLNQKLNRTSGLLDRAIAQIPGEQSNTIRNMRRTAIERFLEGSYGEATTLFMQCLKRNQFDFVTTYYLATTSIIRNKVEIGLDFSLESVVQAERHCDEWASLASVLTAFHLFVKEDFKTACGATMRALKLDPTSATAHYENARMLIAVGQPQRAIPSLEAAIKIDPYYWELAAEDMIFKAIPDPTIKLLRRLSDDSIGNMRFILELGTEIQTIGRNIDKLSAGLGTEIVSDHKLKLDQAYRQLEKSTYAECELLSTVMAKVNQAAAAKLAKVILDRIDLLEARMSKSGSTALIGKLTMRNDKQVIEQLRANLITATTIAMFYQEKNNESLS